MTLNRVLKSNFPELTGDAEGRRAEPELKKETNPLALQGDPLRQRPSCNTTGTWTTVTASHTSGRDGQA